MRQTMMAESINTLDEERILICLSSSKSNETVIRAGARMAEAFGLGFIALYVETSDKTIDSSRQEILNKHMKLVEDLGGGVIIVYGDDIPLQIGEFAKVSGIHKIIIGRTKPSRGYQRKKSYVDRLLQQDSGLELYIIPDTNGEEEKYVKRKEQPHLSSDDLGKCILIILCTSAICSLFHLAGFSDANIITVYIMGVLFTSLWTNGRIYGVIASLSNVIIFNLFFTEPKFTLRAYESGYPVTFLVMLIASLITSSLALKVKIQSRQVAQKAYRTEILLETSRILQKLETRNDIIESTANQIRKLLNTSVVYYKIEQGKLSDPKLAKLEKEDTDIKNESYLSPYEIETASWVYSNNKMAGATTEIRGRSKYLYLSIRGMQNRSLGVIGIRITEEEIERFVKNLMFAIMEESGIIIERLLFNQEKKEVELKASQEALRANVLRSISHDLRTPLTSISGNAGILMNHSMELQDEKKQELYVGIYDDSMWLIQLVENLLAVTRMENGSLSIKKEPEMLEDVIVEALKHIDRRAKEHTITYQLEEDYMMGIMDGRLIVQVIINLINNAIKYAGNGSNIKITVTKDRERIKVGVIDNGEGIKDDEKERLFEMFYTINKSLGDSRRGLGLGLFLCNSIVTAHGGKLWVEDNYPHGSIFYFTLEASEVI